MFNFVKGERGAGYNISEGLNMCVYFEDTGIVSGRMFWHVDLGRRVQGRGKRDVGRVSDKYGKADNEVKELSLLEKVSWATGDIYAQAVTSFKWPRPQPPTSPPISLSL